MKKFLFVLLACLISFSSFGQNEEYTNHFAFKPISPAQPSFKLSGNPIDSHIVSKMRPLGIVMSPIANKETLIRRVYMDLTGLKPTFEEVEAFKNDSSKDAYEKLVDRLLSSRGFGEKFARNWMDVSRYSDTRGANNRAQDAKYVYAWTYRRYLVDSFASDKPYDKFLREQLSADIMIDKKESEPESLAALGFLSIGKFDNNQNNRIDEKIDTVSKSMIGLTVACARCHHHKFDPIRIEDYYSWHGIFSSLREQKFADMPLIEDTSDRQGYSDYLSKKGSISNSIVQFQLSEFSKWTTYSRSNSPSYFYAAFATQRLMSQADARDYLATNRIDRVDIIPSIVNKWQREISGTNLLWEAYKNFSTNSSIPKEGLLNLKVKEVSDYFIKERVTNNTSLAAAYSRLLYLSYNYSVSANKYGADVAVPLYRLASSVIFSTNGPAYLGTPLTFQNALPNNQRNAFDRGISQRENSLIELEQTHPAAPRRAEVLTEGSPSTSKVFIKGNANNRGELAPKGYLKFFDEKRYSEGSGRYELAKSIASTNNALTPRVISNRVWLWLIGKGIVEDPDNFGMLSENPIHSNLLDFLSSYLIQNNWSIKSLTRLIVTSNTYKQSSVGNPRNLLKDSDNRYFWRANPQRISFEELRDSLLLVSGELEKEHDGRPISLLKDHKRSLYAYLDRSSVPNVLKDFDVANPDFSTGKRNQTIVPQQALFFMNDKYVDSRVSALIKLPSVSVAIAEVNKIEALYKRIFSRLPSDLEVKIGIEFIKEEGAESYVHALLMSNEFSYVM